MNDAFAYHVKSVFVQGLEERKINYRIFNNVVVVTLDQEESKCIRHRIQLAVSFFCESIMLTIMNVARTQNRREALKLLQEKNGENAFGKYWLMDNNEIQYKSRKCIPKHSKDSGCVAELIEGCLREFAKDYNDIVDSLRAE